MTGKLIVIEGQGFTGKTTQARMLAQKLKEQGIKVIDVRHPGGTVKAERIRQELFEKKSAGVLTVHEEAKLIFEALESLVQEVIMPALKEGTWVICTRYSPSAFVYQGWVGVMDM